MKNQIIASLVAGIILLIVRETLFADRAPKKTGVMV